MFRKKSLIGLCTLGLICSNAVLAFDPNTDDSLMFFKVRGSGIKLESKQKGLPTPTNSKATNVSGLFEAGYGIEGATTVFFNHNVAVELAVGFSVYRTKATVLNNISNNYNGPANPNRRKDVYTIPGTLTVQYHIAPYGAIRPYVGGGYHAAYVAPKSKAFKLDHTHGPVIQAGVDIVFQNDTVLNFDIKQYFSKSRIKYKTNFVTDANGNQVTSKVKINPTVFAVGFGWKL